MDRSPPMREVRFFILTRPSLCIFSPGIDSLAVVLNGQVDGFVIAQQGNINSGGLGMFGEVSQRFLGNLVNIDGSLFVNLWRNVF